MSNFELGGSRYVLGGDERREKVAQLIETHGLNSDLTVVLLEGGSPLSDLAREVEQVVFDEHFGHMVPHSPTMMEREYGPYEDHSLFLTAFDGATQQVVGTIRIVAGIRNKTLVDLNAARLIELDGIIDLYNLEPATTWDISTLAVLKDHRGWLVPPSASVALYYALLATGEARGIENAFSVIDLKSLRLLNSLGIPWGPIHEVDEVEYLGSHAQPCYVSVDSIRPAIEASEARLPNRLSEVSRQLLFGTADTQEVVLPERG